MKIKTDLRAGDAPGQCHLVLNRFGNYKKIMCPYPPFKFPCYRTDLLMPGDTGSVEDVPGDLEPMDY